MADKKVPTEKESVRKIKDLKIELLKNPTKKKSIKKEIARLLTMKNIQTKLEDKE
jgi:ribosomal protein L29